MVLVVEGTVMEPGVSTLDLQVGIREEAHAFLPRCPRHAETSPVWSPHGTQPSPGKYCRGLKNYLNYGSNILLQLYYHIPQIQLRMILVIIKTPMSY